VLERLEDRLTPAGPSTVYVNPAFTGPPGSDPDGAGPATAIGFDAFPTIQQGLDAVADSGTVMATAGTYAENLTVRRSVTLQGAGSGATVLSGQQAGIGVDITTANGVALSGLTVRGYFAGLVAGPATSYLSLNDVPLVGNNFGGSLTGVNAALLAGVNTTFFVTPTAVAQPGGDPLALTDVRFLTVDGGNGRDSLIVFLNDINTADTVWYNSAGIARDTAKFLLFYRGGFAGGISVVLGGGPETVMVQSQLNPGGLTGPTTIYAEGGDDVFNVAVTGNSNYTNLTLDGGDDFDTVNIFDQPALGHIAPPSGTLRALPDGTLEFVATYPGESTSRIHEQNVERTQSNLPASS
jgi:hypothetical protein